MAFGSCFHPETVRGDTFWSKVCISHVTSVNKVLRWGSSGQTCGCGWGTMLTVMETIWRAREGGKVPAHRMDCVHFDQLPEGLFNYIPIHITLFQNISSLDTMRPGTSQATWGRAQSRRGPSKTQTQVSPLGAGYLSWLPGTITTAARTTLVSLARFASMSQRPGIGCVHVAQRTTSVIASVDRILRI